MGVRHQDAPLRFHFKEELVVQLWGVGRVQQQSGCQLLHGQFQLLFIQRPSAIGA